MLVIEFFHRDFLTLLGALKQCDKYHIGVVTQHEFKDAVQRVLGHGMSEQQWGVLKNDVGLDPDGLRFLNTTADTHSLNLCVECEGTRCRPGAWNRKEVGHFFVRKITMRPLSSASSSTRPR